jgi:hypothetical protein
MWEERGGWFGQFMSKINKRGFEYFGNSKYFHYRQPSQHPKVLTLPGN